MTCRTCLLTVKRGAVICQSCNLICHSKCAENAPPTCDLRAQLLQYAQFAENGSPNGLFSSVIDPMKAIHSSTPPTSEAPYTTASSITEENGMSTSPPRSASAALKFIEAFKRPRAVSPDNQRLDTSASTIDLTHSKDEVWKPITRKPSVLKKVSKNRPISVASSVTERVSPSLRSARESDSLSSRRDSSYRSRNSTRARVSSLANLVEDISSSRSVETRHKKKDSNCSIQ